MTAAVFGDPRTQGGSRDNEGHREFTVTHLVKSTNKLDGPYVIMTAAGLPAVGSTWAFGNDADVWAFCTPYMQVKIHEEKEGDANFWWRVEQKFTTKPLNRCSTTTISDPLSEPQKISGSFVKYMIEARRDRFGNAVTSSSHELFHGPEVEFDANRPTVRIEQNVSSLGLTTFAPMIDCVNDATLWGLARRCVKLSNVAWERKLYGICTYYYTRSFDFDVNYSTFDRVIIDSGYKVLNGHWNEATGAWTLDNIGGAAPNSRNPLHFKRMVDRDHNPIKVMLDGAGKPLSVSPAGTADPDLTELLLEYYAEANFLTLNIPTSL